MSRYEDDHLYRGAIRHLSGQPAIRAIGDGYYKGDLVEEILEDPRIGDAGLNIPTYRKLLGQQEWEALLARHAHDEDQDEG